MSKNAIPDGYYESEEYKKFCEERTKKYQELTGQSRTQYIDDQLKIKEETIKGYEKIKKEAEENPDKNIWDNDYVDMRKLHFARLEKYGRSTLMEKLITWVQKVEYIHSQPMEQETINIDSQSKIKGNKLFFL